MVGLPDINVVGGGGGAAASLQELSFCSRGVAIHLIASCYENQS